MKGEQQLKLSHESVREALEHYLLEHFAQSVTVAVVRWTHTLSGEPGEAGMPCVLVDFRACETDALAGGLAPLPTTITSIGSNGVARVDVAGTNITPGANQDAQPLTT